VSKLAIAIAVVALVSAPLQGDSQQGTRPAKPDNKQPSPEQAKVSELMQRKQRLTHEVLDALIKRDFKRINKDASTLVSISKAAEFQVHRGPRYSKYSADFQEAAEKMAKNARDKNEDGTTLGFTEMMLSCIHCHDYIREKAGKE
jgi:hypothetical protein